MTSTAIIVILLIFIIHSVTLYLFYKKESKKIDEEYKRWSKIFKEFKTFVNNYIEENK